MDEKNISIACQDFCSSLLEVGLNDFERFYPVTVHVGKLVKLCEALRSDINEEKEIKILTVQQLMNTSGFYNLYDFILQELQALNIINIKEKSIIFNIERQSSVLSLLGGYWKTRVSKSNTKDVENALMRILLTFDVKFLYGNEKDEILSSITDINQRKILMKLLENLGLLRYIEKYDIYYSPNTFGKNIEKAEEKISSILKSSNAKIFESLLGYVKENPGIPYNALEKHKEAINSLIQAGIIDPIEVQVGIEKIPFLWSPNPKVDDDLFWAKKAASHFKYGQYFAKPIYGRLKDPALFIRRLLDRGFAGSATNIGIGYNPLVLNRIIRVQKTGISGRYVMYPLKKDILTKAESLLESGKIIETKQLQLDYFIERLKNPNQSRLNPILQALKEKDTNEMIRKALEALKNE